MGLLAAQRSQGAACRIPFPVPVGEHRQLEPLRDKPPFEVAAFLAVVRQLIAADLQSQAPALTANTYQHIENKE